MTRNRFPRLHPAQVCFVVDDVDATVEECVDVFGWGPFHRFSAPVAEAHYKDWVGSKTTDVALGMAGAVQVELIHVREGHDTVEAYQARYGAGFQHLGISCRDREQAIAALTEIGAVVDDQGEHPGIRFAFVDTPTGPGMFELLQADGDTPPPGAGEASDASEAHASAPKVTLDRATIVTNDLDRSLDFYSRAFRWEDVRSESYTLRFEGHENRVRRARGQAGQLLLELVEPNPRGDDLYTSHLARGDHGLVHAGGISIGGDLAAEAVGEGEWLEDGEAFCLYSWPDNSSALQIRGASK
jgi:catechol 2,3-dioxygenase-like lactoylglutathione lyase family enzyme